MNEIRLLEPAAGDGAFFRGLGAHSLRRDCAEVVGVELVATEAHKAEAALSDSGLAGHVAADSFLRWAESRVEEFEAAVGNPPFVRFQFVSEADRSAAARQLAGFEAVPLGVSNLWISVFLRALTLIKTGGAFAFVVPTEILTGVSAGVVRSWLRRNVDALQMDMFEPGSFPGVLQEVIVVSGRVSRAGDGQLTLSERNGGSVRRWTHRIDGEAATWTRYLLSPSQLDAFAALYEQPNVTRLGDIAKFEVSIVTGANDFFTLDLATMHRHALERWARPLLPRIRHAPGLRYGTDDHERMVASMARGFLLDFSTETPNPESFPEARDYLRSGMERGIADRYKCRIRRPWFRVPGIRGGTLMLSKRSHSHPRLVVNEAAVLTTDTIYRGFLRPGIGPELTAHGIAAGFHSSMTMLAAEIEGRSFGGGVLELVPTEIARLPVVGQQRLEAAFDELDEVARMTPARLVEATDAVILKAGHLSDAIALGIVADARVELLSRRLARNEIADRALPVPINAPLLAEVS